MRNILFGLSTQARDGKYLYYGAYDTDDIQSLVQGELAMFFASKSAGPDADTGAYTGGGSNDDLTGLSGSNIDVADAPNVVTGLDRFYFAQGTGAGNAALLGNIIDPLTMKFKVLEYVAPVQKVQTVTIAAASIVAGKVISFSAYSKGAPIGAVGMSKIMDIEYLIPTGGTATTVGAALKVLVDAHPFSTGKYPVGNRSSVNAYIASCAEAHSSDVVLTITWGVLQDGDIKNNSWATATSTIATTAAFVTGNGYGAEIVAFEKECAIQLGHNFSTEGAAMTTFTAQASTAKNYHLIVIDSKFVDQDPLGLNPSTSSLQTQYIAIDTTDTNNTLLEEIVSLLTDMVEKRAIASGVSL
jgi:hypothetical protein